MSGQGTNLTGLAFGFSGASKKPIRNLNLHDNDTQPTKNLIIGFGEDGGLQIAEQPPREEPSSGPKIIPKLENTYRPNNRPGFVPSYIPQSTDDQNIIIKQGLENFAASEHDTAQAQHDVTYGLITVRPPTSKALNGAIEPTNSNNKPRILSEAEQLKADLKSLPPQASLEKYQDMPVEAFGEALLRGMGWTEGRAIGRGQKEEIKIKDLVRRPHRLGLGAAPAPIADNPKKFIKPGESRQIAPVAGPIQHNAKQHDVKHSAGEKRMRDERETKMSGTINKRSNGGSIRDRDAYKDDNEAPWLVPNIRVKIIDKRLHKGRYYLKKGIVVDVKAPKLCDVYFNDTKESVLDVTQSQLETVVPGSEGTLIQVLLGKYAGQRGRLLKRNTTTSLAAVQFLSDMTVHKLSLDDISEYCGPVNDEL